MFDHGLLWPVSNWLWASIVNHLLASLRQITPRRMVYLAAFVIFAWAAAEWYFSTDMAMLLVGDSALYVEIVAFTYIAVARARIDRALMPAMRKLRLGASRATGAVVRPPAAPSGWPAEPACSIVRIPATCRMGHSFSLKSLLVIPGAMQRVVVHRRPGTHGRNLTMGPGSRDTLYRLAGMTIRRSFY
jgi:hypothetical protein